MELFKKKRKINADGTVAGPGNLYTLERTTPEYAALGIMSSIMSSTDLGLGAKLPETPKLIPTDIFEPAGFSTMDPSGQSSKMSLNNSSACSETASMPSLANLIKANDSQVPGELKAANQPN